MPSKLSVFLSVPQLVTLGLALGLVFWSGTSTLLIDTARGGHNLTQDPRWCKVAGAIFGRNADGRLRPTRWSTLASTKKHIFVLLVIGVVVLLPL